MSQDALQGSQQRGSRILGFFWVPPPAATTPTPTVSTLLVVTQAGLELWTLAANSQVLTFREARKHPTQWFIYSHEMRLVLLGSGEPASLWLQVRKWPCATCFDGAEMSCSFYK